jgi:hypothetical protein
MLCGQVGGKESCGARVSLKEQRALILACSSFAQPTLICLRVRYVQTGSNAARVVTASQPSHDDTMEWGEEFVVGVSRKLAREGFMRVSAELRSGAPSADDAAVSWSAHSGDHFPLMQAVALWKVRETAAGSHRR